MDAKELYMLAYQFPKEIIPEGLRAGIPRVEYDEKQGWVGEYWYYTSDSPVARMYVKLHLPDGLVLKVRKFSEETEFPLEESKRDLTQAQMEYLEQCIQFIDGLATVPYHKWNLIFMWERTLTTLERTWMNCMLFYKKTIVAPQETAPPKWLVEYWSADRTRAVISSKEPVQKEYLLPTEKGQELWCAVREWEFLKLCIPKELVPSLPRLSYSKNYGWIGEYWCYYVNAGFGLGVFKEPKYYLRISLTKRQVLEVKNLTDELRFRESWLDAWATWTYKDELDYLARCERLMEKGEPSEAELVQLEGLWLEAQPEEYVDWLQDNAQLSEEAIRWILSSDRIPSKKVIRSLLFYEMHKGIRKGSPDISEICVEWIEDMVEYEIAKEKEQESLHELLKGPMSEE